MVDGAACWATTVRLQVRDCCRLLGSATRLRVDGMDGVALCIPPPLFRSAKHASTASGEGAACWRCRLVDASAMSTTEEAEQRRLSARRAGHAGCTTTFLERSDAASSGRAV